jgi:hypothetical protein
MIPQVLSLIQRTFTGAARGKAMSAYAAVLAGGVIVGQIAGGLLISADLFGATWRPVFLVNVPIGAVLLAAGWRKLPAGTRAAARGLDRPGLLTLSPAVLALVVPLVLGQPEHWPVWGWAWLAGSAVLFAGFARIEGRLAARGGSPLVPGRVLRLPGAGLGIAALFAVMTVFGGFFFALALHLQGGLGDSPLRAGPTFAPSAATFAAVSLNWQRLPARARPWLAICGFAGITVALLTLARILDGGGSGGAALYLALALLGGAMAAAFSPLMTAVLMRVPGADAADATGVIVTVNQLGLVIGVATFGTLYLNLAGSLPAHPGMAASGQLSAHAAAATCVALAGAALAGGGLAAIRAWTTCRTAVRDVAATLQGGIRSQGKVPSCCPWSCLRARWSVPPLTCSMRRTSPSAGPPNATTTRRSTTRGSSGSGSSARRRSPPTWSRACSTSVSPAVTGSKRPGQTSPPSASSSTPRSPPIRCAWCSRFRPPHRGQLCPICRTESGSRPSFRP